MRKRILGLFVTVVVSLASFTGCGGAQNASKPSVKSYEEAIELAKGTTVTFYGWGGDEQLNKWIDDSLAITLKEKYDITLERVPMAIDEVLAQLSSEKQADVESGSIDMIWINGENFAFAKENGFLCGPFTKMLPNMEKYIDVEDVETNQDFGTPIEGYEAPYSKAQLVMMTDTSIVAENIIPTTAEEFLSFCKSYPGKVTYPALPDFTGSAFVRNIIYEICGTDVFKDVEPNKEEVKVAIEPALTYLKSLNPYLWKEGKTFPASSSEVQSMFQEGELLFHVSYSAFDVGVGIDKGIYAYTTKAFQFKDGTIGNTNYIAIGNNASNQAGAIVAINEVLSVEMQASKFQMTKNLPVVDYNKLEKKELEVFNQVDLGEGNIPQETLAERRLPEMPAVFVPIIEEIWLEEVVGK